MFAFEALLFIGLSFGGSAAGSSLSLLFSGLNILFVFSFFCDAASDCCLLAALAAFAASFSAGADFLLAAALFAVFPAFLAAFCLEAVALLFFAGCLVCFVTGVTVAEAFGFAGGFRLVFGFGCDSSDSEEYIGFALLDGLDLVGD